MEAWQFEWVYRATFTWRLHREDVPETYKIGVWHFQFLINTIAPLLQKQNTYVQDCIFVDKCGALFLASLGSGNNLMSYRKQFRIPHGTTSIIFSGFVVL